MLQETLKAANHVREPLSALEAQTLEAIAGRFPSAMRSFGGLLCADVSHDAKAVMETLDLTLAIGERLGAAQISILNVLPHDRTKQPFYNIGGHFRVPPSQFEDLSADAQGVWNALVERGYQPHIARYESLPDRCGHYLLYVESSHTAFATVEPLKKLSGDGKA